MTRRARRGTVVAALLTALSAVVVGCGSTGPHRPKATINYVALGDSYTSFPGSSSQINVACLRSSKNYPHLVASALNYHLVDMSCSGATTADLTSWQNLGAAPQFVGLTASTQVVTVSIGANNSQLSSLLLGGCVSFKSVSASQNNPCEVSTFNEAASALELLKPTLIATYQAIRAKAPDARVIVVGYPQILGNSGTCARFPLAAGDVAYVNTINSQLNNVVQQAALTAGVEYLDLANPSMTHGICSADPWINGMTNEPGKAFPLHPYATEQQAVAMLLEQMLKH